MRTRTIVIAAAAVLLVVIIALVALSSTVDSFRPKIQTELQQKLNRPVTLGQLHLKILPLEIQVDGLTIGESPNFPQDRPFASASTVFVSARLLSLLSGNPEVKSIALSKPQIELIKNAAGVWNFSTLGKSGSTSSSSNDSQFTLNSLSITDGQVGYTDQLTKQPRAVYDHINLGITDFAPGKQFGLSLGIHFPGEGRQTLEFSGKAGPLTSATENALPPVSGHLSIQQVSLDGVTRFASGALPPATDSVASGEADINSLADVVSCKGSLNLDKTVLKGSKLDYPIVATYNLEDDTKARKLFIRSGVVQLGTTSFTAMGSVDTAPASSSLDVALKTDNSSVTELAKLAGSFGVGFNPAIQMAGKINADVTIKGQTAAPQLAGSIVARGLQASGGEIKVPVSISQVDLTLTPDSISSNTFTAQSGSTSLAIMFNLLQYTTKNSAVDASVKTSDANIAELLNIAKTYGVDAARGMHGDGRLSLDVHVKGALSDPSALGYSGTASISNASLSTPALKKPLAIATANAAFSQNSVALTNLAASLAGTTIHGSLSAKNFAAPQLTFNLNADKIDTTELQNVVVDTPPSPAAKSHGASGPGLLQLITGNGSIDAGLIKASDIEMKNVKAQCQLNKGVIQLSPLSAELFGGKASGSLSADMRPAAPLCAVKVKLAGVDANNLLSAVSSVKNTVYGNLAADTNLRFALAGGDDLARTLNGTLSFNLTNGIIKNLNIMDSINKVGKFLKGADQEADAKVGGTAVKKFSGTLNIVNGVATTNDLTGVLNAGTLTSKGTLNLVTQDIHMNAAAALSSPSLTVPVLVTGNMAHPIITPDASAMAKAQVSNITNSVLGKGTKGATGAFGSILDQFKKKP